MIGKSLGPYEILEPLGAGGMGEVYRARDTKLNRDVALKLVPEEFAADEHRMARFEREAQLLASLNHPNIGAIYGLEEAGEKCALVLELVEGETLGERIKRGPVPLEECLRIGIQIAEALEAAHESGIIHRDLKPANVKITPDGLVKVLDFGLAKALEGEAGEEADATVSPTLSLAATKAGVILGTAGYMSPEQARGEPADQRADIWAFGVILYEMLTGRQAFGADTVPDTLAKVLTQNPDWEGTAMLPGLVQRLLRRCLTKDPKRRFRDIGDVRIDLEEILEAGPELAGSGMGVGVGSGALAGVGSGTVAGVSWRVAVPTKFVLPVAIVALVAGALGMWVFSRPEPPTPGSVKSWTVSYPAGVRLPTTTHPVAISPDGNNLVYLAIQDPRRWLEVRPMDQLEGREIPGTEGLRGFPFFSPDGRYVGFVTREWSLKKVSLAGEPPQTLCSLPGSFLGAAWLDDDTIVFSADGLLYRVPANGGIPQPVPGQEPDEVGNASVALRWPGALPGNSFILATAGSGHSLAIVIVSLETGSSRTIIPEGTSARYAPTGHITFAREQFLFAAPFDIDRLEVTGDPAPVREGVRVAATGAAHYDYSREGSLVYVPTWNTTITAARLVWLEFGGDEISVSVEPDAFRQPRLSPDGELAAVEAGPLGDDADIYIADLRRGGTAQRLTTEGDNEYPVWSADGEWVFFSSNRDGDYDIYRQRSDFRGGAERVLTRENQQRPHSISSDGTLLLFDDRAGNGRFDIQMLRLDDGTIEPVVVSEFNEFLPRFSPDDQYVAYTSRESGIFEVYVMELATKARKIASAAGGTTPFWSPDGKRLYYSRRNSRFAVDVTTEPELELGRPVEMSLLAPSAYPPTDVHPDGQRILGVTARPDQGVEASAPIVRLNIVLNWFEVLRGLER